MTSLAALSAACGVNQTSPESVGDIKWTENHDKWLAQGLTSYDMEMRAECYCGAPYSTVLVVVRNGEVQSRTVLATGDPVEATYVRWFPDVPGLYGVVRDALDRKATYVGVRYDKVYFYPSFVQVDYGGGNFGDKFSYAIDKFTPRP